MSENKLNRLERSIVNAEDSAEDARWLQAEEVVRRLDRGETERDIAASWVSLRTGNPYSQKHVNICATIWRKFEKEPTQDRPRWEEAYAGSESTSRSERAQAQAPKTIEAALKLAQNVMKSSPPKVQDALYYDLKLQRAGADTSPAGRKAAEAAGEAMGAPIKKAMAALDGVVAVQSVESATETVREVIAAGAVTSEWMRDMDTAVAELQTALAEARFVLEV